MKHQITIQEKAILMGIYNSEYQDFEGRGTINYNVWGSSLHVDDKDFQQGDSISYQSVLDKLVRRGLACSSEQEMVNSFCTVCLTEDGYDSIEQFVNPSLATAPISLFESIANAIKPL